jgi:DtxR family transcriptional regulator, Mn-dependent transcriptional regulator
MLLPVVFAQMGAYKMTTAKEDYLKTILDLVCAKQNVQVSHVAARLRVTRASASRMLKNLEQEGLVSHQQYGPVLLTIDGTKIAEKIVDRYQLIQDFLVQALGLDSQNAQKDACRIEHAVSPNTIRQIARYLQSANDQSTQINGKEENQCQEEMEQARWV